MNMKILIIDDDITFANGIKLFLESRTIPAATATNVAEAKRILNAEKISLICTDWDLSDGTGLDVLRYASEKKIPVVFLTGHDEDSYNERAKAMGVVRYYIKGQVSYREVINDLITLLEKNGET